MKIRIWTGNGVLLSIYGEEITDFNSFCAWFASQPDGVMEIRTGRRWAVLTYENLPFCLKNGSLLCDHPSLKASKTETDPDGAELSRVISYQAWRRANQLYGFWETGINEIVQNVLEKTVQDKDWAI